MRKFVLILLSLALVLCFVGCEETNETVESKLVKEDYTNISIWTDEETGVQYIVYSDKRGYAGMGGITPRLNADGTLYTEEKE